MKKLLPYFILCLLLFISNSVFAQAQPFELGNENAIEEGIEIDGVIWATRNVGAPGAFAPTPDDADSLYHWNSKKPYPAVVKGNEGIADDKATTSLTWESQNDPCPEGWQVPTAEQFKSLLNVPSQNIYVMNLRNEIVREGLTYGYDTTDVKWDELTKSIYLPKVRIVLNMGYVEFKQEGYYYWSATADSTTDYQAYAAREVEEGSFKIAKSVKKERYAVRCVKTKSETGTATVRSAATQHAQSTKPADNTTLFQIGITNGYMKTRPSVAEDFRAAAERGDAQAQYDLGTCYHNGRYGDEEQQLKPKDSLAVIWWTKAAEQGQPHAQIRLGTSYLFGEGVAQNDSLSAHWYRQAAEQKNAQGQYNLAVCYQYGKGVPQSDSLAIQWYVQAILQDFSPAMDRIKILSDSTVYLVPFLDKMPSATSTTKVYLEADSQRYEKLSEYARLLSNRQEYAEADEYYRSCLPFYEQMSKNNPRYLPYLAGMLNNMGNNYNSMKNYAKTEEYYLRSLGVYEQLSRNNSESSRSNHAVVLKNIGFFYCDKQKDCAKAEGYYLKSLKIQQQLARKNPKEYLFELAYRLSQVGFFYKNRKEDDAKAQKYYLKSLKIFERLSRDSTEEYIFALYIALYNVVNNYADTKEYAKAAKYYLKYREMEEQLGLEMPEEYRPQIASTLNNMGNNCAKSKGYVKAEKYYLRSIEIYKQLSQNDDFHYLPDFGRVLSNIGINYSDQENYEKAEEYFLKSLMIRKQLARDNPDSYPVAVYNTLLWLSRNYHNLKNNPSAIRYRNVCNDLLINYKEQIPQFEYDFASNCGSLSYYHIFIKEYTLSEQFALKGLAADSSQTWIKTNLAAALLLQGKYEAAKTIYKELSAVKHLKSRKTYGDTCLEDLEEFEKAGAIPEERKEDVEKIRKLLKK